jgi:hypothetical protein
VLSALLGVVQLLLMGTADLMEPAVKGVLALTDTSKDTVSGQASLITCLAEPAAASVIAAINYAAAS